MNVAGLITFMASGLSGVFLLATWIGSAGHRADIEPPSRFPIGLVVGHVVLATGAFVCWLFYVVLATTTLGWIVLGILAVVAFLGFGMFVRWFPQVRGRGTGGPLATPE